MCLRAFLCVSAKVSLSPRLQGGNFVGALVFWAPEMVVWQRLYF